MVNAKQYLRIIKRREKRRKLNFQSKFARGARITQKNEIIKKAYQHESRHKHAMNRERGKGGRFAGKNNTNANPYIMDEDKKINENENV